MTVACDNEGTSGSDPNSATTNLYISTNGGSSYSNVASISATVTGGNFPDPQFDSLSQSGTHTVTGITDVTLIKLYGTIDCDTGLNGKQGSVEVIITSVTPNSGTSGIVCDDTYYTTCSAATILTCTVPPEFT